MSRSKIYIDREKFEGLLSLQCTKDDIAGFFHCSIDTIERYCARTYRKTFSEVSEEYKAIGRISLRRTQFAMAKTNPQMAIHLGKQYLGQADKAETKVSGGVDVKHGNITRVIYYDPETQKPTEENISGEESDVDAFVEDRENYNGDTISFMLPNKDPDPAELQGEMTHVSPDGSRRYHIPYDGREDPKVPLKNCATGEPIKFPDPDRIQIRSGSTGAEIEFPDDGRGGYGAQIELRHKRPDGSTAILEDYDDGRGGYTDFLQKSVKSTVSG